jgi:small nuclear ribonucleoprotein (snRNP)-like protein
MSQNLTKLIGLEVEITTVLDSKYTGLIYSVDMDWNILVLCSDETNRDFHFINQSHIKEGRILNSVPRELDVITPDISIDKIFETADESIRNEMEHR